MEKRAWISVAVLAWGCASPTTPPETPVPAPTVSPTVVAFSYGPYKDWGTVIADAACSGTPTRFDGSGYEGYHHVAFWLQGANQHFFPGTVEQGRVPGAVLIGEGDVVDGKVSFTRTFGPRIGPTEDGGQMTLLPGSNYGWVVVGDGAFSSFVAVTIPPRPCFSTAVQPHLAMTPTAPCAGDQVTITGVAFTPGNVTLQLWKPYQPAPGELNTGKAPPEERALGEATADAGGSFSFAWPADVVKGGQYTLRAFDQGRTRLTTLDFTACP
jgi:hypothetical protein